MAAAHITTRSILSSFLPRVAAPTTTRTSRFTTLYSRQLSIPVIPSLVFAIPSAIQLNIPQLLEGLWESVLRAVPKKKTSYMKKRSRQLAGKGMKDVTSLNKCSACGHVKRAHLLCPYCVSEIQTFFKKTAKSAVTAFGGAETTKTTTETRSDPKFAPVADEAFSNSTTSSKP